MSAKRQKTSPAFSQQAFRELIQKTRVLSKVEEGTSGAACIGTHNGTFHCDEALATALLKMLPEFSDHAVVRSRRPETIDACAIVVDVGATYDAEAKRFDHHQKTFGSTLDGYSTKLSSAGLIYKHFGRQVIESLTENKLDADVVEMLYHKVYVGFVEHIDGIDNGIEVAEGKLNYKVTTNLSSRVGSLNPSWNEEQTDDVMNGRFREAMLLTGEEFSGYVLRLANSWWPARSIVQTALTREARTAVHPSGEVMMLPRFCPWQAHLFAIEEKNGNAGTVKYALYQDSRGAWRIQAVPVAEGSFTNRLPLPEAWRGVRDEALSELSGIDGCIFVHAAGFIGGNKTKEGVVQMAASALKLAAQ